jgi:trehalose 6-phosphate synthase
MEPARAHVQICSYRGPVTYVRRGGAIVERACGPGGLERLLQSVADRARTRWLFSGTSATDRSLAHAYPEALPRAPGLQMLYLTPELQRGHYDVIGGLLADAFHYGLDSHRPITDRALLGAAWRRYVAVNDVYARVLMRAPPRVTLIQDHHLLLVAPALREADGALGERPLHYFHHIPWCEPGHFGLLPGQLRRYLLTGALAHDAVGFHTARWAVAFMRCCERFLPGAICAENEVRWSGRSVAIRAIPATIDTAELSAAARSPAVSARAKHFQAESRGRKTVVRVDRWTRAKNALRGFLAVEELLLRRPELAPEVWFLAVLTVPHRAPVAVRSYHDACRCVVTRVNERFRARTPAGADVITLLVNDDPDRSNREEALAAMQIADTMLVNPVFDGMNLVAKESCVATRAETVLVLSRNAGAAEELGGAALLVDPFDVLDTTAALDRAIAMPARERRHRAARLREAVGTRPAMSWLECQIGTKPASARPRTIRPHPRPSRSRQSRARYGLAPSLA